MFGLVHGEQPLQMCSLIVHLKEAETNTLFSFYPILKSPYSYEVVIDEVEVWEEGAEATISATLEGHTIHLFAVDYYAHRDLYRAGNKVEVELSGLAYTLENLKQNEFSFEGQQALDFLLKTGNKPTFDDEGKVESIKFDLTNLVAYLPKDKYPEDAEFQSKVSNIEYFEYLDICFCAFDIVILRTDSDDVKIRMCVRKDRLPARFEEGTPLMGVLWLQARLR